MIFFACFKAAGQDSMIWLKSSELKKEGYYKNLGFTQHAYRIGITKDNKDTNNQTLLRINNPHVNRITLSQLNGATLIETGDFQPFYQRPVYFWDFILPLQWQKTNKDSLILTIDNSGESQVFFLEVLDKKEFQKIQSRDTFLYGGLLAYAIFFAGLFITLGLLKKNKSNVIFGVFTFCSMLWIFNIEGVLYQFLWPDQIFLQHASRTFFSSITIGTFVLYFIQYYHDAIHPIARKIFYGFAGFFLVRLTTVLALPEMRVNNELKYVLLIIGTLIIIAGLILLLVYQILLFRKRNLFFHNLGTAICFLFILKEGLKLTGIDISPYPKEDNYISVFTLVTILTTISLDNIQSYRRQKKQKTLDELQESRKKDKEVSDRILEAQENERSAIGKNIHDQVGGLLAALKIQLETLKVKKNGEVKSEDAEKLIRLVDNCTDELYKIVDDLSAPEFEEQDLSLIIQNRIELYEQSTGICFDFDPVPLSINLSTGLNIYRIICELITNSVRHSKCENIRMTMSSNNNMLNIIYSDDGIGFDIEKVQLNHGIQNIKSRIGFLNGNLNISSKPGNTLFSINIPLG